MRFLAIFAVLLGLCGPAWAFSDADRTAVQSTIEGQLKAFLSDDASGAYAFAAPNIQAIFPTDEIFMNMVRQGYQPVYRSMSHQFGELKETSAGLEQTVDIVDASGKFWTAIYTLQQQPDGSWKITACRLVEKPGEVA